MNTPMSFFVGSHCICKRATVHHAPIALSISGVFDRAAAVAKLLAMTPADDTSESYFDVSEDRLSYLILLLCCCHTLSPSPTWSSSSATTVCRLHRCSLCYSFDSLRGLKFLHLCPYNIENLFSDNKMYSSCFFVSNVDKITNEISNDDKTWWWWLWWLLSTTTTNPAAFGRLKRAQNPPLVTSPSRPLCPTRCLVSKTSLDLTLQAKGQNRSVVEQ